MICVRKEEDTAPDIGGHTIHPRRTYTNLLGLRYFGRPIPAGEVSQS